MASKGERMLQESLDQLKIENRTQYTFQGCKDKRCLPYDFMIMVDGRVGVIEYDGRAHFEIVKQFHGSDPEISLSKFQKQQNHDLIKNRYTRDNNISLLRISYKEDDEILKWLTDFIHKMKSTSKRVDLFSNPELYNDPYQDPGCIIC